MEKFLAAVRNMFNVPDLRRRIFFTLGLLAVYRLGAHVTAPGINTQRLEQVWRDVAGTLLGNETPENRDKTRKGEDVVRLLAGEQGR